jgi:endonuclease/exonuclease/phosphatase family metal-dependent hydrolase
VIIGDFNEFLFSNEKEGGNPRPQRCMQAFRDALTDCELEDIGYTGDTFTWKRGRIRERLDRVVGNGAWLTMNPGAVLTHLEYTRSDHRPILLDTEYKPLAAANKNSPKRFEGKWLRRWVL